MNNSQQCTEQPNTPFLTILQNITLHDKNWFQTGGPAKFFCEPTTAEQLEQALAFAKQHALDIFFLGQGANTLISDDGFDGLVIRPQLKQITHCMVDETTAYVCAGAGVVFHDLIDYCLQHNFIGLEEFSGIPGTVGGSVYINIHYYEFLLQQFLVSAQVIHRDTGHIMTVDPEWFDFGYDQSKLQDQQYFLVNATFKVTHVSADLAAFAKGRRAEIIRHRERRFPTQRTCGSFFRNFLPEEVVNTEKKLIYVAYYLDKIGVKGELSVGDAVVSHQHANMLINRGKATSSDIIQLAQKMQQLVQQNFGIKPQAECQLIGFKNNPLA